jgi:hypothetical protein
MRRNLLKSGNDSFAVTLPKTWVIKNNLKPSAELEIIDDGTKLIISTQVIREESYRDLIIKGETHKDAIFSAISHLYNEGHTKVRIIVANPNDCKIIEDIEKFVNNLFGITVFREGNNIYLTETCNSNKSPEIIMKCFQNILGMTNHFNEKKKDNLWHNQAVDCYYRIFFNSEYISRLAHTEEISNNRIALRYSAIAWSFECIAFLLKRIAEHENENANQNNKYELDKLFQNAYNVYYKNQAIGDFYKFKIDFEARVLEGHYDSVMRENLFMFSFMCAKLLKQYSAK